MSRLLGALGWATFTLVMGFAFCTFAWTAGNIPPPTMSDAWPFPSWLWTTCMGTTALLCLVTAGYGVFAMLDSITGARTVLK